MNSDPSEILDQQCRFAAAELARQMRSLGDQLLRMAKLLEADPSTIVSSLGEIQSQGTIIDAKCGRLVGMRDALEILRGVR